MLRNLCKSFVLGGEEGARLNILNHTVSWKVFGKPPLLRCGRIIRFSCHTECSLVAPFVWV